MIKLVAFDWNGTIFADTQTGLDSSNKILKTFGKRPISVERFRQTFKIPVFSFYYSNGMDKEFLIKNAKRLSKMFIDDYEPRANHCRSRSGVRQALYWLHVQNIDRIIFSNHTRQSINSNLARLKLLSYFKDIIAHNMHENTHHKNMSKNYKEDTLLKYLKQKKLKSKEILVVGDTEEEIDIGKKYGFYTLAISGGYNTASRLKKRHPDFLIHNMVELKKIIQKLNS